jgi:cell division protein FtsI (penicillin-binding protein 3)
VGTGFPGEGTGNVPVLKPLQRIERANISYGYAMTMTPLQVVQAYGVIASGGVKRPVSLLRVDNAPQGERVIDKKYTDQVTQMLKRVVTAEGTGSRAKAISYSVAGKTGTAYKAINGRYSDKQIASFIGMAPADNPRIVAMVIVDEPQGSGIYTNGGWVAAPAFSKVAEDALRMLQVPPDNIYQHDNKEIVDKAASKTAPAKTVESEKSAVKAAPMNERSAT